jgi:hypothetical protein
MDLRYASVLPLDEALGQRAAARKTYQEVASG